MSSSDPASFGFMSQANYAFLADHIPDDPAGKDDFGLNSRQKRRRTSPQDQAILEAAYQRNSKPDKNERMQIVGQVALGEKEVQVWYQNRRQADRRKSRPLLPHELVPHFRNGVPFEVLQHSPQVAPIDHERCTGVSLPVSVSKDERQSISRVPSIHQLLNSSTPSDVKSSFSTLSSHESVDADASLPSSFEQSEDATRPEDLVATGDGSSDRVVKVSSARKRDHEEMSGRCDFTVKDIVEGSQNALPQSSVVRLSMTADGAVKIRTSDQATPSPPKERAPAPDIDSRRTSGLQRSKSAIGASEMGVGNTSLPLNFRAVDGKLGRSRDARTWEFYCDSETRDSLSSHAEYERNGSAVGAINLIRSQGQRQLRQMLSPVISRTNPRVPPIHRESKGNKTKAKLSRAKSSLARLQATEGEFHNPPGKDFRPLLNRSPSGDSDKENWAPGTQASRSLVRKEHAAGSTGRLILGENRSALGQIDAPEGRLSHGAAAFDEKENELPLSGSLREKGSDLDCVQGLLSLSQGAWR